MKETNLFKLRRFIYKNILNRLPSMRLKIDKDDRFKSRVLEVKENSQLSILERFYKPRFDNVLITVTVMLLIVSIVMVYSTTGVMAAEKLGSSFYLVKRQIIAGCIGLGLMLLCIFSNIEFFKKHSAKFYVGAILLLILPLVPGLGYKSHGAYRWVAVGPIKLQPGEFAKLAYILFLAGFFARREKEIKKFSDGLVKPIVLLIVISVLYWVEPDNGSIAVLIVATAVMAYVAGVRISHTIFFGCVCSSMLILFALLKPHAVARLTAYTNPQAVSGDTSLYQLRQSLIALAGGEVAGRGLSESQQKLFFLPAAHTDFIFSVIGEEFGFIGCSLIILLFLLFLWRGLKITARNSHDTFKATLAAGLTFFIVGPAFINMGVVTGLLPTKGLVLPLIGYGGSSLITCLTAIGILLALSRPNYST
jgi:cell division protein FtsW